jgi:diguanylate cyclase (GGDEF)-like protein
LHPTAEDEHQLAVIAHVLATAKETRLAHHDLERLVLHDPLTGLPNRAQLVDRLDHAIRRGRPERMLLAVVCLDVDRLRVVNDTLGYRAGDELLFDLGCRLAQSARPEDTAARYSADKFVVLCEGLPGESAVHVEAERLRRSVSGTVQVAGRDLVVIASAGLTIARAGASSDELLREAELALYQAQDRRRGHVERYDPPLHDWRFRRFELESDLRRAVRDHAFLVHYQPVVQLEDGVVVTTECLVRWPHPQRGLIGPVEFIPLAEESRLIVPLGEWVLNQACQQARHWADQAAGAGAPAPGVAVNLSARQISEPHLLERVRAALDVSALPAEQLTLEITESVVMGDAEGAIDMLRSLKDIGVGLSIDDFGTGYSSLSYLKSFPVDILKIDRSFVAGLGVHADDAVIVSAIIRLGDMLGIETVAEGVETASQAAELLRLGCARGQGYYFARPEPADQMTARLGFLEADSST